MKKLKLNLDDLKVESFEISDSATERGTVFGQLTVESNELSNCNTCPDASCDTCTNPRQSLIPNLC